MARPSRLNRKRTTPLHAGAAGIEGSWLAAFEQAWEAYREGDVPAGAVLTGPTGEVVSRGRNRAYDKTAPHGHIGGSILAHAVIDVLLGLPSDRRGAGFTLWVTTEPCPMCVGAAVTASVELLRFASADIYAGGADNLPRTPHADRANLSVKGPLDGAPGLVGAVLQLEPFMRHNPEGAVVQAHKAGAPEVHQAARRLASSGVLADAAGERARFAEVLPHLLGAAMAAARKPAPTKASSAKPASARPGSAKSGSAKSAPAKSAPAKRTTKRTR